MDGFDIIKKHFNTPKHFITVLANKLALPVGRKMWMAKGQVWGFLAGSTCYIAGIAEQSRQSPERDESVYENE